MIAAQAKNFDSVLLFKMGKFYEVSSEPHFRCKKDSCAYQRCFVMHVTCHCSRQRLNSCF